MSDSRVPDHAWDVRARMSGDGATVYCRTHSFTLGAQVALRESDPHPSAIEGLLGALSADLIQGFRASAKRRRIEVDGIEASLSGRLDNALTYLGVIGEEGHPGLASVRGVVYVTADAEDSAVQEMWRETLSRSPLYNTLCRCAQLDIELHIVL